MDKLKKGILIVIFILIVAAILYGLNAMVGSKEMRNYEMVEEVYEKGVNDCYDEIFYDTKDDAEYFVDVDVLYDELSKRYGDRVTDEIIDELFDKEKALIYKGGVDRIIERADFDYPYPE